MELPVGLEHVRTTPMFDEVSVPDGLLAAHRTAKGVWGRLVVETGSVDFAFEDDESEQRHLASGDAQVIPPTRPHRIILAGPATFCVEFHR